ncbi:MAG: glucosaminidase domain-containing protein [Bacteroidota bacterium]
MKKFSLGLLLASLVIVAFTAFKSGTQMATLNYIDQWKEIAIENQREYGIPASITLAQGIHESASGTSKMARGANNHFGIKCLGWSGGSYFPSGNTRNSCYRKYDMAEDSFCDHARILKSKPRYAFLFKLEVTNYKGWAKGLKKAGYASHPKYPLYLIRIIEDYNLAQYDEIALSGQQVQDSVEVF